MRLDQYLSEHHHTQSLEQAKAYIMAGIVYINGEKADKPGESVPEGCKVEIRNSDNPYVSRGGFKLEKALQVFPISLAHKVCLDIGASTGGFTDCMLQNHAKKVYSVDVGYGQLAWKLRSDERVINLERTNIRKVTPEQIPEKIEFFSVDVSFISLGKIYPAIQPFLSQGCEGVCLVKPQFEAPKDLVGKNGVVHDPQTHCNVLKTAIETAQNAGFTVLEIDYSPIKGPKGNIEFLMFITNQGVTITASVLDKVETVVSKAHQAL